MATVTLDDNERTLLMELLGEQVAELSHEIHQTDNHLYRDRLQARKDSLEKVTLQVS